MKFEDLFVKQRPPKDYVSYPPQETPTLEKFFAERTNKSIPSPIEQTIAAPRMNFNPPKESPVEEQELQKIKQQYSLQQPQKEAASTQETPQPYSMPQQQASQPMPQTPRMPAYDRGIDLASISELADSMAPKNSMEDYLPALAPAILGALGGGRGEGFKIAGDYLAGKVGEEKARKQKLEDMLFALEKSRLSKRGQKGLQLKSLRDRNTGEPAIGSYDPSTDTMYVQGRPVDTSQFELAPGLSTEEFGRRQGIQSQTRIKEAEALGKGGYISPETGLRTVIRQGQPVTIREKQEELNPKQIKDLQSTVSKFVSSDAYKKPANSMQAAAAIDELIASAQSGNPSAAQFARKELAKIAEGGGKLSDQDFEMAGGSPSYRAKAKRFANLQKTDQPLTPQELKDLKEIANILYRASEMKLRQSISDLEQSFIQKGGIKGAIEKEMAPYIPAKQQAKQPLSFEEWKKKYGTKK